MATVYSLICFGGKDGHSVTVSSATDYVTLSGHGLNDATAVAFTSGTLPSVSGTALSLNTSYYSKSISSTTFELYYDSGLTSKINFTSNGSSLVMKSSYYLGLSDKTRWTYGGTEYIFNSMTNWVSGRSTADVNDTEVCEIGMAWDDETGNNGLTVSIPCGEIIITTMVNGVRSSGFHNGIVGVEAASGAVGYRLFRRTPQNSRTLNLSQARTTIDGFTVWNYSGMSGYTVPGIEIGAGIIKVKYMIVHGRGNYTATGIAFTSNTTYSDVANCVVLGGWSSGINVFQYRSGISVSNCFVTDCTTGMASYGSTNATGSFINNISIGNTTNWGTTSGFTKARNNAGLSTDSPWDSVGGTAISLATTDFTNFANKDFTPNVSSSPQVDAGADFYGSTEYVYDIAGNERPSYNNGGTETIDVGPYEFDLGYGLHPESRTIDFSGLVSGSQVIIYTTDTTTELARNDSTGTTYSYDAEATGVVVDYTILKAGYSPIRVTGVSLSAASTPVAVQQTLDRAYTAPSGLTFGTNVIVNVTSRVVTSLQVTTSTTVQNWYSYLIDSWIASSTNTTLKNVEFPVIPFGEASFTTINGIEFSDGATSIAYFSRDGFRYSSDGGTTATAIWAAILTLNTPSGHQVKYRQSTSGTIVNASSTGVMDQLIQVYGDASHGNFDYRGHLVLRAPKPGWSQPQPDIVATYGNLVDGLFVAALEPVLQYTTTNADVDATHLVLDNTAKTFVVSASHTMLELYQRAQWWANQDAQWDADIPLTTTNGTTFTQPSTWTISGVEFLTGGGTIAGGSVILNGPDTYTTGFNGCTITAQEEGIYDVIVADSIVTFAPTANAVTYTMGDGVFTGTVDLRNTHATRAITVELPAGTSYTTANNTGATITVSLPSTTVSISLSGFVSGTRIQIYDTLNSVELFNDIVAATTKVYTETYSVDRTIRVRAAYVSGTSAKGFVEENLGTVTSSAPTVSRDLEQIDDTVYNTNAVNGSLVSGITFTDATTDTVNIDISGGSTDWQDIYAAFVYWMFTVSGIADDIAYVQAVDTANYRLTSMKIKNTSSPTVPLEITGGYGVDNTTGASIDLVDTTGGTLVFAPDHVVAKVVSVGGVNVITGDIADIPAKVQTGLTSQGYTNARATKIDTISTNVVKASKLIPASE